MITQIANSVNAREGVEQSKHLTQSRKGAKNRKVEVSSFFASFASFAPLRETCWSESQIPL
jgi:hypothetical protein